ncbi:hypothetical protein F5Y16DRAFT_420765 [Xylariaceae sp. FL0255]|nr:hypothetical protein F5Y16DRAFT_420765 [Xylariaceae sp. FL0255]
MWQAKGNGRNAQGFHLLRRSWQPKDDVYTQNLELVTGIGFQGYGLSYVYSQTNNGTPSVPDSLFLPDPDLQRSDADISLFFLFGNGIVSTNPVDDPWYRFTVLSDLQLYSFNGPISSYRMEEAASPLACAEQWQFCTQDSCGPLASFSDAITAASPLFNIDPETPYNTTAQLADIYASDEKASQFIWLLQILTNYPDSIDDFAATLGPESLNSVQGLLDGVQGPLPDDQWKLDITNGPGTQDQAIFRTNATNPGQKSICQNQKILSTAYTSVSLFGLFFTYIIGSIIIVISFILNPILMCAQKRWKNREYENVEWICNETLQLQRLAYEESGQGEWPKCLGSVPITDKDQKLGPFNLSDPEHPLLHAPESPPDSPSVHEIPHASVSHLSFNNASDDHEGTHEEDERQAGDNSVSSTELGQGPEDVHAHLEQAIHLQTGSPAFRLH